MPSGHNYGVLIEKELVNALNGKRYMKLPPNLKTLVRDMFGVVNPLDKIKCEQCEEYIKPDIVVTIKDKKRYVSVKSGTANVVHSELITTVVPFLRSCGVSEKCLKTLCLYHFGDGTLDGSGKVRKDYHETYEWLHYDIKRFNDDINDDHNTVISIIERFMFQGVRDDVPGVDYLYFGDLEFGMAISKGQILRHLSVKSFNFYENLHIGPLLIRPHAKYAHTEIKNDYSHKRVDFYWPNLKDDVKYIYQRYSNYYN